jgi:hypothetical protein
LLRKSLLKNTTRAPPLVIFPGAKLLQNYFCGKLKFYEPFYKENFENNFDHFVVLKQIDGKRKKEN